MALNKIIAFAQIRVENGPGLLPVEEVSLELELPTWHSAEVEARILVQVQDYYRQQILDRLEKQPWAQRMIQGKDWTVEAVIYSIQRVQGWRSPQTGLLCQNASFC